MQNAAGKEPLETPKNALRAQPPAGARGLAKGSTLVRRRSAFSPPVDKSFLTEQVSMR